MNRPECLHIPTLHEGEQAQISWGAVEANNDYIVERVFNETFLQALSGYTWDNFDSTNEPWSRYDQDALNWHQIETRTGKGQHWERLDYERLSWSQFENHSHTWQQLESQEISFEIFKGPGDERPGIEQGCTWLEMDELNKTWTSLENSGYSWEEGEKMTLPGLSWESIDSRWLTFNEWEGKELTFHELDTQKQIEEHRGMTDFIPIGALNAMYRIKAYDSNGDESDYLETAQLPIIPIFYRNSTMEYPVKTGKHYAVLLKAQDVSGLDKIRMNLRYDPYLLELTSLAAGSLKSITEPGNYPEENLRIYSSIPGKLWFQSTRQLSQNECFSGSIALVEFIAKGTGSAAVSLF
ncbi:cohesin domain-containing protein [Lacrimispora sp.]|uniref:cohesin domain-containing protein n=1 Tax=Lacrimispora sp. TaxID=2719234 RepID=UPI0028AB59A6|nr:cohesin domain-containing protein [Lacrimispora sp.]